MFSSRCPFFSLVFLTVQMRIKMSTPIKVLLYPQSSAETLEPDFPSVSVDLLKWYYDQKIISFFSSDFESVFA